MTPHYTSDITLYKWHHTIQVISLYASDITVCKWHHTIQVTSHYTSDITLYTLRKWFDSIIKVISLYNWYHTMQVLLLYAIGIALYKWKYWKRMWRGCCDTRLEVMANIVFLHLCNRMLFKLQPTQNFPHNVLLEILFRERLWNLSAFCFLIFVTKISNWNPHP